MGTQLSTPVQCKAVERHGNTNFKVGTASMNGYREHMEDAHAVMCKDDWGYFAVFDGHCGSQCSKFCAESFPQKVEAAAPPLSEDTMKEIALAVDKEFLEKSIEAGSTATMMLATKAGNGTWDLQIANVGDSRVLACIDGKLQAMTTDHKPSLPEEKARIERCGGHVPDGIDRVDGNLAMSRAMGDREYKQGTGGQLEQKVIPLPDITTTRCRNGDYVVLICDGIVENNFDNAQVIDWVQEHRRSESDLTKLAGGLCDEALNRGSKDNMTVVIVEFTDGTAYHEGTPVFVPAAFPTSPGKCRAAYREFVEGAGFTLGHALQLRHEELETAMRERLTAIKSQGLTPNSTDEEISSLKTELENYKNEGGVKLKGLEGAERDKWFQELGDRLCAEQGDAADENDLAGLMSAILPASRAREVLQAQAEAQSMGGRAGGKRGKKRGKW